MIVWRLLFSPVLHFWTVIFLLWNSPVHWCCWHEPTLSTHTHTRLSGTTRVSQYQKGKTNLDFTGARDSEWQWHQLGCMQVCTSLQTDNHASTLPLSFLQAGCPFCRATNSVKALNQLSTYIYIWVSTVADGTFASHLNTYLFPRPIHSIWELFILCYINVHVNMLPFELVPSVLWHCWLGIRKSIQPVKIDWWSGFAFLVLAYPVIL